MRISLTPAVVLMAAVLGGCGYTSKPLINPQYQTIAIDIFENRTPYRDFEFVLQRALTNRVTSATHMRLAPKDKADTLLTGQIANYEQVVLTEDENDRVKDIQVIITLNYEWRDLRTGQAIRKMDGFRRSAEATFALGETRDTAAAKVLADVAESLIEQLEEGW